MNKYFTRENKFVIWPDSTTLSFKLPFIFITLLEKVETKNYSNITKPDRQVLFALSSQILQGEIRHLNLFTKDVGHSLTREFELL